MCRILLPKSGAEFAGSAKDAGTFVPCCHPVPIQTLGRGQVCVQCVSEGAAAITGPDPWQGLCAEARGTLIQRARHLRIDAHRTACGPCPLARVLSQAGPRGMCCTTGPVSRKQLGPLLTLPCWLPAGECLCPSPPSGTEHQILPTWDRSDPGPCRQWKPRTRPHRVHPSPSLTSGRRGGDKQSRAG